MNEHDLKINVHKIEIMLFKEKKRFELAFMNENILSAFESKFLGIFVTIDPKFAKHIETIVILNIRKQYTLFAHLAKTLDFTHKKQFFPFILYATRFLLNVSAIKLNDLTITFKRAIKLMFRLPFLFPLQRLLHQTVNQDLSSLIHQHSFTSSYLPETYYDKISS